MRVDNNPFENYRMFKICGGDFLLEKPIFCKNGKALAVGRKETCHLYSSATGEHLGQLFSCSSPLIALQIDDSNDELVIVTEQGLVYRFNIDSDNEPLLVCKLTLDMATLVNYKVVKNTKKDKALKRVIFFYAVARNGLVYASWSLSGQKSCYISVFDYETGIVNSNHQMPYESLQQKSENLNLGREFILLLGTDYLKVVNLSSKVSRKHMLGDKKVKVTKIAVHAEENIFGTGDSLGRVVVWRNIFEKVPLKEVYHWHSLPVRDLTFTACGTHIFSGGEENVLVKWSLSNQMKTFLPRLSGTIHHISISQDNSLLSVSTSDGKITIVSPTLTCLATIQHFSCWDSDIRTSSEVAILAQDPRTDTLVLQGRTGHLQFLSSADSGRFLYTLDVTQRNYIAGERKNKSSLVDVRFARFSRCGKWLVTAESGPDEVQLKFWAFVPEKQQFTLNTHVDSPHGAGGIAGLEVGAGEIAATIGPDKTLRLWGVVESVYMQQTRLLWAQIGHGSHRQLPPHALDIARDGSLVAVGFGPSLTLWDTLDSALKCSLTPPLQRDPITVVRFGYGRVSHLVVSGTENELVCWNMVTLMRQWIVPLQLTLLISDPGSCYMCAISETGGLFIFEPSSPNPEFRLEKTSDSKVVAGLLSGRGGDSGAPHVYLLTDAQELYCLGDVVKRENQIEEDAYITPFAAQIAEKTKKDVLAKEGAPVRLNRFTADVLEGPAHGLPHVSLLCEDLLKGLLISAPSSLAETHFQKNEDVVVLEASDRFLLKTVDEVELKNTVDRIFSENYNLTNDKKPTSKPIKGK